ncbi:RusA family crossover junction endodeoxyribonuclease [Streptomyces sp. NPDC102365]|uniref:RusA family crossover junction endodeoxyribonuclease n=1 Tax=Streptomyces sp. NPDC102365 TaxID=3366162 RepID=UPI00382BF98A
MNQSQHPLDAELAALDPHSPPSARVEAAYRAYTSDTGEFLATPPTAAQRERVRRWLMEVHFSDPRPVGYTKAAVLQAGVHSDVDGKAQWLQQGPCMQCRLIIPTGSPPLPTYFAIPVRPFTKQVRKTRRLISQAVRAEIQRSNKNPEDWRGVPICVTVVSVQASTEKLIDVDNAAKAILDTMNGTIFPDDRQVQHLSVSRLTAAGTTGYYLIGLRPAYPNLDDVVDHTSRIRFLGTIRPISL